MLRITLLAVLVFLTCAPASALVGTDLSKEEPDPFCPARAVLLTPIHQMERSPGETDLGTDRLFAVTLQADAPKTVSGSLQVLSNDQPFSVSFSDISFTPATLTVTNGATVARSQTIYNSAPIYFALPAVLPVDAVWVFDLAVNGKPAICGTLPLYFHGPKYTAGDPFSYAVSGTGETDIRSHVPGAAPAAIAEPKLDRSDCPQLVTEGLLVSGFSPTYPSGLQPRRGEVYVKIAVDAAGKVADAAVYSSKVLEFDRAAFYAAVHSQYEPRRFLCTPVPGFYLFRTVFNPP